MQKFKAIITGQIFLLPPCVEDFIKEDHLARLISEVVDRLDITSIENRYSYFGQKSYHPRLLLKLWMYGYAAGTLSGRKIAVKCETDTAYMFLASMYTPDFRTINDFRKDNIEFFTDCFKQVLQICRELGMGKVGLVSIDGTKMRANASVKKQHGKESYQQWLTEIDEQINLLQQQADEINSKEDAEFKNERGDELPAELRQKKQLKQKIEDALSKIKSEDKKVNLTDIDSQLIKCSGVKKPAYNFHGAVSEDGIILATYATNKANDKEQLVEVISQVEKNTSEAIGIVLADSGYSSYENYQWLQERNIEAYMPDQEQEASKERMQDPYDRAHFKYQPATNNYICPTGNKLEFKKRLNSHTRKQYAHVYEGISCNDCPVRTDCTSGSKRQIYWELREPLRDAKKIKQPRRQTDIQKTVKRH
jgi:transposase